MKVIWKPIPGFNGRYEVSNTGVVKRLAHKNGKHSFEKIINQHVSNGYMSVNILYRKYSVHRLVAMAFISNPEKKPQINHKNGIKVDNSVKNLEWCTVKENSDHAWKTGLIINCPFGEEKSQSKLTNNDVLKIRKLLKKGALQKDIVKKYNVSQATVSFIKTRKAWRRI